jgi:hypothetical protein
MIPHMLFVEYDKAITQLLAEDELLIWTCLFTYRWYLNARSLELPRATALALIPSVAC